MKSLAIVLGTAAMLSACLPPSVSALAENSFVCLTDTVGTGYSHADGALAESIRCYICLAECGWGEAGIGGFEFSVNFETAGGAIVQNYGLLGGAGNSLILPEFHVVFDQPHVPNASGLIPLVEVSIFSLEGPAEISLEPVALPAIEAEMAVIHPTDPDVITAAKAAGVCGNIWYIPTYIGVGFVVNCGYPCGLDSETATWGAIRKLFH